MNVKAYSRAYTIILMIRILPVKVVEITTHSKSDMYELFLKFNSDVKRQMKFSIWDHLDKYY